MMSEYEYNTSKPDALLTGYSTVRGAELKSIYEHLANLGDATESALFERFGRPTVTGLETKHVDQCLRFLRAIDVVELSAQNVVSLLNRDRYPGLEAFEPRLLAHVRQQRGDQYHLAYVFDVLADQDVRRITEESLLEAIKADDGRTFDLTWRGEKLRMWANLFDPLGAISYTTESDENEIVASPTRALLYDLLSWYADHGDEPERFVRALEWIDEEFFPVFTDRPGTPTIAVGVADVLSNMESEGVLELRSMSDTETVAELPLRNGSSRNVATFAVGEAPDRPAYWYPLDRAERRAEVVA